MDLSYLPPLSDKLMEQVLKASKRPVSLDELREGP